MLMVMELQCYQQYGSLGGDVFVVFGEVELFGGGGFDVDCIQCDFEQVGDVFMYGQCMWVDFGLFVDYGDVGVVNLLVVFVQQVVVVFQEVVVVGIFLVYV